jgi:hypothetical protein
MYYDMSVFTISRNLRLFRFVQFAIVIRIYVGTVTLQFPLLAPKSDNSCYTLLEAITL